MTIAVVGANGRVGTELCLRLAHAGVDVVGVTRTTAGSAFLRHSGIECRHGRVDDSDSRSLLLGCDTVVNLAYRVPRSHRDHERNRALVRGCVQAAEPGAAQVLASTIMVHGPDLPAPIPDGYGLEKRLLERLHRRTAGNRATGVLTLRIGHVLGDLQPLSHQILAEIHQGATTVGSDSTRASNTVHVALLADTVRRAPSVPSGTYDLLPAPQWSWGQVYAWHATQAELDVPPERLDGRPSSRALRSRLLGALLLLPEPVTERLYGRHLVRRARADLADRGPRAEPAGNAPLAATRWRELHPRPVPGAPSQLEAIEKYLLGDTWR